MATAFVLMGSLLGFFGGLVAHFGFDVSVLAALAIWISAGPLSAVLAAAATARPGQAALHPGQLAKAA